VTTDDTRRYEYQISFRSLVIGIAGLSGILLLLLASVLEGIPASPIWWVLTSIVGIALALTVYVAVSTHRARPIEVVVGPSGVEVPGGAVGTRQHHLDYRDIRGVRLVGRASFFGGDRTREVMYLIYGERYALLMSEMFTDWASYTTCRDTLLERIKAARPDVRVDVDGATVHGHAEGDLPQDEAQDVTGEIENDEIGDDENETGDENNDDNDGGDPDQGEIEDPG